MHCLAFPSALFGAPFHIDNRTVADCGFWLEYASKTPLEVVADLPHRMRLFWLRCQIMRLRSVHIKPHYSQNAFDSALLAWYERGISLIPTWSGISNVGNINRNNKIVLHVACFRCQFNLNSIVCYLFVMDKMKIKTNILTHYLPRIYLSNLITLKQHNTGYPSGILAMTRMWTWSDIDSTGMSLPCLDV